jgi:hemerythrin-like metal-binding protein
LSIGDPVIDETHREFVDSLNALMEAPERDQLAALDAFVAHCESHFGQESRWMNELDFGAAQCHRDEHETVLSTAREVRRRVSAGEGGTELVRFLATAVAQWFENHAASMDTVLSLYMKEHGYVAKAGA